MIKKYNKKRLKRLIEVSDIIVKRYSFLNKIEIDSDSFSLTFVFHFVSGDSFSINLDLPFFYNSALSSYITLDKGIIKILEMSLNPKNEYHLQCLREINKKESV